MSNKSPSAKSIAKIVKESVDDTFNLFRKFPNFYYSEKDIHWILCKSIQDKIEESGYLGSNGVAELGYTYPPRSKSTTEADDIQSKYKSILVHQELGTQKKDGTQTDITIISPKELEKVKQYRLKKEDDNYPKPSIAMEISTEIKANSSDEWKESIEGDFNALIKALEGSSNSKGYLLVFYRIHCKERVENHEKKFLNPLWNKLDELEDKSGKNGITLRCEACRLKDNKFKKYKKSKKYPENEWKPPSKLK